MIYGGNTEFKEFYDACFNKLYFLGLKYTNDVQIVEDSIQNLFISFIQYRKRLPEVKNVNGYIYKSFYYLLIKELRKRGKLKSEPEFHDSALGFYVTKDPVVFSEKEEQDLCVKQVLGIMKTLPKKQQEAIYLKFTLGLTYAEMAEYLHITIESSRVIISRAMSNIRSEYKKIKPV